MFQLPTLKAQNLTVISEKMEDFVGAKFYCPHALVGGNQRIWIREKTLEFSSTVSPTLSLYDKCTAL